MGNSVSNNLIFRNILEMNDHMVIFSLDSKYRYLVFNENHFQTMKRIWGCNITLGHNMLDYISDDQDRLKAKNNFDKVLSGESFHIIEEYGDKKFERRSYDNIYSPILDDNKIVVGLTVMLTDITEEINLKRALKESNATKDKFVSLLAHDLINPFNTLLGFSELILKKIHKSETGKIKMYVERIHSSLKSTYDLLINILEWSRIQQDKIVFNPQKSNLHDLVYEAYLIVNYSATDKNITINLDIPADILIEVDREMIKTVIRNLVTNAIKYTPENGSINITANQNPDNVAVEISDTGTGMTEQIKNTLFKDCEINSTEGTNYERGTGLGLLLCKEFIERHNGNIWVESELNQGSSFYISIPNKQ